MVTGLWTIFAFCRPSAHYRVKARYSGLRSAAATTSAKESSTKTSFSWRKGRGPVDGSRHGVVVDEAEGGGMAPVGVYDDADARARGLWLLGRSGSTCSGIYSSVVQRSIESRSMSSATDRPQGAGATVVLMSFVRSM